MSIINFNSSICKHCSILVQGHKYRVTLVRWLAQISACANTSMLVPCFQCHKCKMATSECKMLLQGWSFKYRYTHATFFLSFFIKNCIYLPPLLIDLPELIHRIEEVIDSNILDSLTEMWEELDFRLNDCCITNGAHIEHL